MELKSNFAAQDLCYNHPSYCHEILASILRAVGIFTVPIFEDPGWLNVTVFAYTVAEPGTYLLAACFPTYRSLFSYLKSERLRSTLDATKSFTTRSQKYGNITRNPGDSGKGYMKQVDDSRDTNNLVEEESSRWQNFLRIILKLPPHMK
ncbi:uncharacterized protein EAF02_003649 [Botrytis sinoallii]|uniref:uncharacterized protein n=1 Tax=Botrytis sinoallii TaxID=1463999 RepID=UPI001902698F|nr:uncharacterized protein EAF02_003649 [Botrytis sinoallii]KAF7887002.1 hypothetical protein EAF02_003649 [Botrytis sinoallii]